MIRLDKNNLFNISGRNFPICNLHSFRIDSNVFISDLNLLDWGSLNQLALALAGAVYIWNPSNGETCHLMQLEGEDYVSSVRWIGQGSILAVGNSNCQVQVIRGHTSR